MRNLPWGLPLALCVGSSPGCICVNVWTVKNKHTYETNHPTMIREKGHNSGTKLIRTACSIISIELSTTLSWTNLSHKQESCFSAHYLQGYYFSRQVYWILLLAKSKALSQTTTGLYAHFIPFWVWGRISYPKRMTSDNFRVMYVWSGMRRSFTKVWGDMRWQKKVLSMLNASPRLNIKAILIVNHDYTHIFFNVHFYTKVFKHQNQAYKIHTCMQKLKPFLNMRAAVSVWFTHVFQINLN